MTKLNKRETSGALIELGAASAETKGTLTPVAPIDNRGQYKPDTMALTED